MPAWYAQPLALLLVPDGADTGLRAQQQPAPFFLGGLLPVAAGILACSMAALTHSLAELHSGLQQTGQQACGPRTSAFGAEQVVASWVQSLPPTARGLAQQQQGEQVGPWGGQGLGLGLAGTIALACGFVVVQQRD